MKKISECFFQFSIKKLLDEKAPYPYLFHYTSIDALICGESLRYYKTPAACKGGISRMAKMLDICKYEIVS